MKMKEYYLKPLMIMMGIALVSFSFGQKGVDDGSRYGKGQDSINCLTNTSLYREYVRQKMYTNAIKYWRPVFNECPYSSKNIYLDGVKIYKYMAEKELDMTKKEAYIDTIVLIYDYRIKYNFGSSGYVNQYKGLDLLALRSDNIDAMKNVYDYFRISIEELKDKTINPVFQNFIKVGINLYNQGKIEAQTIVEDYMNTLEVLEKKGDAALIKEVNEQMISSGIISCEQIIAIYTPKFEATPNDKDLLITITNFLDQLNCEDEDLYYKALSNRHKVDPTATSAKMLTVLANKKEKYNDAVKFAEEAIRLETDNIVKADLYLQLAHATNKKGDKAQSRAYALKATEFNPNSGEPYLFVGSLYAESTDECGNLPLPKSIYWVAVDKFIKAKQVDPALTEKAEKSISTYSKYYPNKEEAFFHGVKEGDNYKIECWINETTTARFN